MTARSASTALLGVGPEREGLSHAIDASCPMRRALIFAVAAALASGDESINFFSVAASSEEVALALCAWRSYYISLRPLAPNLRFFLLAGSSVDTGRTCVAASAALSRAKPHGWENQTDDWIRCRVVTAGRFGWRRGDDCAPGLVQGATVTIIRPTAFPRGVDPVSYTHLTLPTKTIL